MRVFIQMTEEERGLAERYAEAHGLSVAEAMKQSLFEKIEDEYDRALYDETYREYLKGGQKSRPLDELFKEINV